METKTQKMLSGLMSQPHRTRKYTAPDDTRIVLVVGPYCWGTGRTGTQALKNARFNASRSYHPAKGEYLFFDAPKGAYIDEMGRLARPSDSTPAVEVGRVLLPPPR